MKTDAMGNNVAFTAPHRCASEIGLAVLEAGGSAVDATIAGAAAISVLYPHMNSLAGDGFWLIQKPGEVPKAIDASGTAAGLASVDWYREQGCDAIPSRGSLSALTLGGTLSGWQQARELLADQPGLPLSDLLAPAAGLARDGITVTESLAAASRKVAGPLGEAREYQRLFTRAGAPLRVGETLVNPDLAQLLDYLGKAGLDSFYRGELGRHIGAELEAAGSPLRTADLVGYRASVVTPLAVNTRFGRCYNLPAPTQGLASLLILAIYDRLYRPEWSEAERVHALVEATKLAFQVRDRELADPRLMNDHASHWLTEPVIEQLAGRINDRAAPWPHVAEPGDTVWLGAQDKDGTMVSFIQSIYWEFGSGLVIPDTGLVWNNRGLSFSLDPQARKALTPGAKPFHTLNPALAVLKDGRRISYGCMGGEGQPQTQAALLTRYLYDGTPLDEAISRGRWLLGRTWGDSDDDLKLEEDLAERLGDSLTQRGHQVKTLPRHSELMGHAGAVVSGLAGSVTAASDPRSDGAGLVGRARV